MSMSTECSFVRRRYKYRLHNSFFLYKKTKKAYTIPQVNTSHPAFDIQVWFRAGGQQRGHLRVAISTVSDPSGSGRVDMLTGPVAAARAVVATGAWVNSTCI